MPISTIRNLSAILKRIATFSCSQSQTSYSNILVNITYLRISTNISYQHNLVHRLHLQLFAITKIYKLEVFSFRRRKLTTTIDTLTQMVNNTVITVLA